VRIAAALLRLGVIAVAIAAGASPLWAQSDPPTEEYRLKAAFVYRFPQFVEWPAPSVNGRDRVNICVTRPNPFGGLLDELIAGETLNGRPLVVREVDRPSDVDECQVLFVPKSGTGRKAVLDAAVARPVLTIGESPHFLDEGGVINLQVIGRRVRFEVSPGAAERVGLRLSSQLLQLAIRVRGAL
jgi:YfiR/HmsC-like